MYAPSSFLNPSVSYVCFLLAIFASSGTLRFRIDNPMRNSPCQHAM